MGPLYHHRPHCPRPQRLAHSPLQQWCAMSASKATQTRRKNIKRSSTYYRNLRQELATKNRIASKHDDNIKRSTTSILKKWNKLVTLSTSLQSFMTNWEAHHALLDFASRLMNLSKAFFKSSSQKISRHFYNEP